MNRFNETENVILKVVEYKPEEMVHICELKGGSLERVDLMVHGDFPKDVTPESLVGKTVHCEYVYPYESIAVGVKIAVSGDSEKKGVADD